MFIKSIILLQHKFNAKHFLISNLKYFSIKYNIYSKSNTMIKRFDNIRKSEQDTREYRGIELENGLKALLVSDPTTDIAAAALSVKVGHMDDPNDIPGLAHFCEHMLFLGTEKYPDENAYSSYLSQNGGSSNAATYPNMTKFYFDVNPDMLEGALDRFAQFFISPLFTETATDREINAVNSEHEKNIPNDSWRCRQVNKSLAIPTHPYSKFGSGNEQTLKVIPKEKNFNVRDELIKFHSKWYSSNMMSLAIIGKESLDQLEEMVVSKFQDVVNKNVSPSSWPKQPYDEKQYGTKIVIVPIKDIRVLTFSFTTRDLDEFYKAGPDHYISHLVGHEAKGSILSELRKRGWCNDLTAGHNNISRGFGFFEVTVDLTEEGINHVDDIALIIFQYLKLLRDEGAKKWIFEENGKINEMQFRFKEKDTPLLLVSGVVHSMQVYPFEDVLSASYFMTDWKPNLISEILDDLVPRKCRMIVIAQNVAQDAKEVEYWYSTKYGVSKIPELVLKKWEQCSPNENLKLPEPNPFIPEDFSIIKLDSEADNHPSIIHNSPFFRVWHKQDTEFQKPKNFINFDFSNPIVYFDPLNCNLTQMIVSLFRDEISEYTYDAQLAGLKFTLQNTTAGISLNIFGYSHKLNILLEKILKQLFNFQIDEKRFDIIKEDIKRSLKNFQSDQPYQHAVYYLALVLTEHAWSKGELLDAMELVTYDRLKQYTKEFFSRLHTECFIYGNVNTVQCMEISNICTKHLEQTNSKVLPILSRQLLQKREYKLCQGDNYIFQAKNNFHQSSCVELYIQCNPQSDKSIAMIDLVSQILTEPCYTSLRTEQQLGYVVFCGSRKANSATGLRIIVQSAKTPVFVEERIETFLDSMEEIIEKMPDAEFERYKNALATHKLEKPKKMSILFSKYLNEISVAQYHFERCEAEVAVLKKIKKEDVLNFYKANILRSSPQRRLLTVHINSTVGKENLTTDDNESVDNQRIISDLSLFKSSKELYPITRPYLKIHPKGAKSKL